MRSFPVRTACLLAVLLLLSVLFLRPESTDAPAAGSLPANRPGSDRAAAPARPVVLLSPPDFPSAPVSNDALIAMMRARIADVDRASNGSFLETLDAVLADATQSIAVASFRIPAHDGGPAMLDTFPDEASSAVEEHDRLVLVYVASAFRGCASDDDYRRRFSDLSTRYPWLVAYLSRQ